MQITEKWVKSLVEVTVGENSTNDGKKMDAGKIVMNQTLGEGQGEEEMRGIIKK